MQDRFTHLSRNNKRNETGSFSPVLFHFKLVVFMVCRYGQPTFKITGSGLGKVKARREAGTSYFFIYTCTAYGDP